MSHSDNAGRRVRRMVADTHEATVSGRLGGDNVFADLGFDQPETELLKTDLVIAITALVEARGVSQTAAAAVLGTTQPKLSLLLRGSTEDVSVAKLMEYLRQLAQDITISITPVAEPGVAGKIRVFISGTSAGRPARRDRLLERPRKGAKTAGRGRVIEVSDIPGYRVSSRHGGSAAKKGARKSTSSAAKKGGVGKRTVSTKPASSRSTSTRASPKGGSSSHTRS